MSTLALNRCTTEDCVFPIASDSTPGRLGSRDWVYPADSNTPNLTKDWKFPAISTLTSDEIKAEAAKGQPRQFVDQKAHRALPHAAPSGHARSSLYRKLPLECRLLIWRYILQEPCTKLIRWRPVEYYPDRSKEGYRDTLDANCFPYRICLCNREEKERSLVLLLCCRQIYTETLHVLYAFTKFHFSRLADMRSFRAIVSPQGFAQIRALILISGNMDSRGLDLFKESERLQEWEDSINIIQKLSCLRQLQIKLGGSQVYPIQRRPWDADEALHRLFVTTKYPESEAAGIEMYRGYEQRHQRLFDLLATLTPAQYILDLSWTPEDVLAQRKWPFEVELHGPVGMKIPELRPRQCG